MHEIKEESKLDKLIRGIKDGEDKELGRAISLLEDNDKLGQQILDRLYGSFSPAYLIGITGPPGSGKSSLIDSLLEGWLKEKKKIAVIAVDPSSRITGGAFLGDRIRMGTISSHDGVFIRSMATRGSTGGLNPAVYDTVLLLSAAGFDMIVIETVGVGQTEIDIVSLADTTVVVSVPEAGDEIQIFKSDLMEVGDIFVLNKSDLPGAAKMEIMIKQLFNLKRNSSSGNNVSIDKAEEQSWRNILNSKNSSEENASGEDNSENRSKEYKDRSKEYNKRADHKQNCSWEPRLVKTSTYNNQGIEELRKEIEAHKNYLMEAELLAEKHNGVIEKQLLYLLENKIYSNLIVKLKKSSSYKELLSQIIAGKISPHQAAEELLENKLNI